MTQDPGAESKMSISPILKYLSAGTVQEKRTLPISNAEEWQVWRCSFQVSRKGRKELQSWGTTGVIEEAPENTKIRSSERWPKARTHTEEEHGENLIPFIPKYELKEERFQENKEH